MINSKSILGAILGSLIVGGCSGVSETMDAKQGLVIQDSYLNFDDMPPQDMKAEEQNVLAAESSDKQRNAKLMRLEAISEYGVNVNKAKLPRELFDRKKLFNLAAESMPLRDFIHYSLGDLLGVNYVLDKSFESEDGENIEKISLRFSDSLNAIELFDFVGELLAKRGIQLDFDSDVFFVYRPSSNEGESNVVIGIGASKESVPKTAQRILQVVPLQFGIKSSTERTLKTLLKLKITPDFAQSALFLEGQRSEIIQALELVSLLDTPAMRGKNIGIIKLEYVAAEVFGKEVSKLLKNEGIEIGLGDPMDKNLSIVPLAQLNAVAVFATDTILFDRVMYWANLIDAPSQELSEQFFVYRPLYSSASDLGTTIEDLLSVKQGMLEGDSTAGRTTGNAPSKRRSTAVANDKIAVVVDAKSNSLIFYTEPTEYEAILPLMRSIDVPPRQVMLDIIIAEVSLKDEFKYGVEWALQRGEVSVTTQGAFGATSIGGVGFSVLGSEGPLDASFLSTNSLVKVLSNPSIMVRDGVTASIDVGSDVSVIGQTTSDPISGERQTTTSEYRQTGVSVSVTPSINSMGTVVMQIDQSISNSVPGSAGSGGNPDIFKRSISTEVVAESSQMVVLGGLISESLSTGVTGVPGLSKIPLLGGIFKSDSDNSDRTELVMLITPRVMNELSEWDRIRRAFGDRLQYLRTDD